jgi:hypothetical protein
MMKVRIAALVRAAAVLRHPWNSSSHCEETGAIFAIGPEKKLARHCCVGALLHDAGGFQCSSRALVTAPAPIGLAGPALTPRTDGFAVRAIARAAQFGSVDVLSSTTSARFR